MRNAQSRIVLICPWWELNEEFSFCGFEFMPKDMAIDRHPELAATIRGATQSFSTGYMFPDDEHADAHFLGKDVPLRPQLTRPTIVVPREETSIDELLAAIDMIAFATTCKIGTGFYTNSAVFESRILHTNGASAFITEETRRMTGGALNLYAPSTRIETRPRHCGQYYSPDEEVLSALELLFRDPSREPFFKAFAALRQATRDDCFIPYELERSFFALVLSRLLGDLLTSDSLEAHMAVVIPLLDSKVQGGAENLLNAYRVTKYTRNEVWHPVSRTAARFPFESQMLVPLNVVLFRLVDAVVIARLIDLGLVSRDSKLGSKIEAINAWIGDLGAYAHRRYQEPTTGTEFPALKKDFENAVSLQKRWNDSWSRAIIRAHLSGLEETSHG